MDLKIKSLKKLRLRNTWNTNRSSGSIDGFNEQSKGKVYYWKHIWWFMHVAELQRLGAKINVKNNKAIIEGNSKLIGAELMRVI